MRYKSTRGNIQGFSFEDVVFTGYANDGGLFMPETIPHADKDSLQKWKGMTYLELCKEIMSLFISQEEIPLDDLNDIIDKAFSDFEHKDIAPLARVGDFYILELFHGATLAFKDIALVTVGQFMDYFLRKRKKTAIVLVATTGDTGSASIESARKSECLDIICLFPIGRCNQVQELQMTTIIDENVHVVGGQGIGEDLDAPLKHCFLDKHYADDNNLCTMNSINWSRIMAQTVHFFYAYFQVCGEVGETVKFVVPTGALGHASAASLVRKMGLPIKIVCAVNENDILHRAISYGDFIPAEDVIYTWSSAMDNKVPYNMERLLYLFSGMDCNVVDSLMKEFEIKKSMKIPEDLRENMSEVISTWSVSCDETLDTMKKCWNQHQYLLCPHTAVGVTAGWNESRLVDKMKAPTVCVATASPAKFPEAVKAAGIEMKPDPRLRKLFSSPTFYKEMKKGEDWDGIVRGVIGEIRERRQKIAKQRDELRN